MPPRLLALSPGNLSASDDARFLGALRAALGAGLRGLLLREPALSDRDYLRLGSLVRELHAELWLSVHDRVHLAGELRADAVHLGFSSLPAAVVKEHYDSALMLGLSTHAEDDPAAWEPADYVLHGPLFSTPSKPQGSAGYRQPIGFQGLAAAVESTRKPIWALGGLLPEHVAACLQAGAAGVAVLSGLLSSPDPARSTELYLKTF